MIFSRFSFGFFCNKKQIKSEKLHSVASPFLGCGLIDSAYLQEDCYKSIFLEYLADCGNDFSNTFWC